MTSTHDNDAFEMRFEDAIRDMHTRSAGGEQPNPGLWMSIRSQIGETARAETADPRAIGPDRGVASATTERNNTMDATLVPLSGGFSRPQRRGISWTVLLAAGLVGIMIVSSVWLNGGSVPPNPRDDLAWAPGMGTPDESRTASPAASPPVYTYGPEFACEVEPLTSEEVFDIVMNPIHAYERRGHVYNYDPPQPEFREEQPADRNNWTTVAMNPVSDSDLSQQLEGIGNTFWNCLMTGTAYQVWGMMDPTLIQWSILRNFPVLRGEDELRSFVEEWGPKAYGSSGMDIFPILIGVPPEQAARKVDTNHGSIRVSTPRGKDGQQTRIGVITLVPGSGDNDLNYYELYLSEHPDGSWSINGMGINPNTPRG